MIYRIESLAYYMEIIHKKLPREKSSQRFYRGLNNSIYELNDIPKIYRQGNEALLEEESNNFSEFILRIPYLFKELENYFEHLGLMQHYGASTRMLDVTTVAAVALYFACLPFDSQKGYRGENEKDGVVNLYDIPIEHILRHNHQYVSQISYLSQSGCGFNIFFIDLFQHVYRIKLALCNFRKDFIFLNASGKSQSKIINEDGQYRFTAFLEEIKSLHKNMNEMIQKILFQERIAIKNITNELKKPIEKIHELQKLLDDHDDFDRACLILLELNDTIKLIYEKLKNNLFSYFPDGNLEKVYPDLKSMDTQILKDAYCIIPKLSNPRLQNQMGAFIIFGCNPENGSKVFESVWPHTRFKAEIPSLIIPGEKKEEILDQLAAGNLSEIFLFPELDHIIKAIEARCKSKKEKK